MTDTLAPAHFLNARLDAAFGDAADDMAQLDARAAEFLAGQQSIVWECDASTFVLSHVSRSAEEILGYPASRWTDEPTFWADVVLHDDRDASVTYCVSETQCDRNHDFEYRARAADGSIVRLRDYVRVIPATADAPKRLRGIMLVID